MPVADVGADPEASYYQSIEEFFVSRRGAPLVLSNAEWFLVRSWRVAGIPLRVVLRGITDALDAHAHSWSRNRSVGSLKYCAGEVEAAFDRWQRALSVGAGEGRGAEEALGALAAALESARLPAAAAPEAASLAAGLRERLGADLRARDVEPWLQQGEERLVAVLRGGMQPEALARLEEEVGAQLAPYASRMPAKVLEQIRGEALRRRVLEEHSLPRLSLFHAVSA